MDKKIITTLVFIMLNLFTTAQTKIIAHRGFSGIAPENTLAAFQKAIEIKADYFELDVHKSKDGQLFVIHDGSVQRTSSNQVTGTIAQMNANEISAVRVGYSKKFGNTFKNEKVPTLKEALELAKGKIKVCIEIKVYDIEKEVLNIVNELKMNDDVIIFSFYYPVLKNIRKLDSEIPVLYLVEDNIGYKKIIENATKINANAVGVGPEIKITKEFLNLGHQFEVQVWKWTVNQEEEMQELIALGLDGIITNHPDKAIQILKESQLKR